MVSVSVFIIYKYVWFKDFFLNVSVKNYEQYFFNLILIDIANTSLGYDKKHVSYSLVFI